MVERRSKPTSKTKRLDHQPQGPCSPFMTQSAKVAVEGYLYRGSGENTYFLDSFRMICIRPARKVGVAEHVELS